MIRLLYKMCRRPELLLILSVMLSATSSLLGDNSITVGVNRWVGEVSAEWEDPYNWAYGPSFNIPNELFPTWVGLREWEVNGILVDPITPDGPTVLSTPFSTRRLTLRAWAGPSQVTLANGGVLTTGRVRLGMAPPDYYQPVDPIENSLLIINGGDLQGPITFYEHASVQVLTDYSQSHPWSGTPDSLFIGGNAKLTFNYDFTLSSDIAINGRLAFSSTADLIIEGDRSLAQPGIIELGGNDVRSEVGPDGRYSLTNLSLIEGYGRLNLPVENHGIIRATGGELCLGCSSASSYLGFEGSRVEVAPDGILGPPSNVAGELEIYIEPGGRLKNSAYLKDTLLSGPGNILAERELRFEGTISHFSRIIIPSAGNLHIYNQGMDLTLAGGGTLELQGGMVYHRFGDGKLINNGNLIEGFGNLNLPVENHGIIRASGGELLISRSYLGFEGSRVEVAPDGILRPPFNVVGELEIYIEPGGALSNNAYLKDTMLSGPGDILAERTLYLDGTISHSSRIVIPSTATLKVYTQEMDLTLAGGGTLELQGGVVLHRMNRGSLINDGNLIEGFGTLNLPVENHGIIRASGGTLAIGRSYLGFEGSRVEVAPDGILRPPSHSVIGELYIEPGGGLSNSAYLKDTMLSGPGDILAEGTLYLDGTISHSSRIIIPSNTTLQVYTQEMDLALAGGGTLELQGGSVWHRMNSGSLINNGNLIEGHGQLNLPVENYGAIEPDLGSPGLVFNRTLNLHPTSSLRFELGFVEGEMIASKLSSPYAIHLEGKLNVSYFGDGAPFDDQMEILLIDAGEITGTFSNLVNGRVFLSGGEGSFLVAESEPGHIVLRDFIPGSSIPDHPKPNTPLSFAKIDGLTLLFAQAEVAGTGVEYSHDLNNWMPVPEEAFHDGTETFWKVADMRGDTPIFYRAKPTPDPAENQ